ncbi:hypothetical protein KP509_12G041200 [Ceratopteris richardii]|uniref:Cyanovirin-N domain-containing protein n=1 Tax=Ceratopteris richardii TaxID=49495 RepID=A0A8T2TIE8_CERRI|nr:hypothetical protein KP509_12G041200 [Ceratopteris richardii]
MQITDSRRFRTELMPSVSRARFFSLSNIVSIIPFMLIACSCLAAPFVYAGCGGNFVATCLNLKLVQSGTTLQALCMDGQGDLSVSSLDLKSHVTNNNGVLKCTSSQGSFSLSCNVPSISSSGVFSTTCLDADGNLVGTNVDLNTCVSNLLGSLTWTCLP